MLIDTHLKSSELLQKIANSVFDRNPENPNPLVFSMSEINVVEGFLNDLIEEIKKPDKD